MATAAVKKVGARANSPKQRPAAKEVNVFEALPKPDDLAKGPYPKGVRVFSYQPKDGSEPILLAMNGYEQPDKVWHFDVAQLPILSQTWKWMDRANIPKDIQRQAQSLPDAEYFEMFNKWFEAMKVLHGGPKGAVTAGK
jgi:hypothetical protein